jgi:uncharacterized protein (UPF0335 family)
MSDLVAVGQLRAFVERIERVEEEIKTLNGDKSDIYKELRAFGFDVKAVRKVVAKRKLDANEREEQDAMFDLYWDALTGASHVHVHEAGNSYAEVKGIDPKLAHTIVTGLRTETGRAALIAAVDLMIEREEHIDPESRETTESPVSLDEGRVGQSSGVKADAANAGGEDVDRSALRASSAVEVGATNSPETANEMDDDAIAAVKGQSRLANVADVEPLSSSQTNPDPRTLSAADGQRGIPSSSPASVKSDGLPSIVGQGRASGVIHTGSKEEQAVTQFDPPAFLIKDQPAKTIRDYRPHCQKPDACGASGLKHCYSCTRLTAVESEVA